MGNPTTDEELNNKVRRRDQLPELLVPEDLNFLAIYIPHTQETRNFMVDKGLFFIDIYCSQPYDAGLLYKRIKSLIYSKTNRESKVRGIEVACDVSTIYKFRLIVSCLIDG